MPVGTFEKTYLATAAICFFGFIVFNVLRNNPLDGYDVILFGLYSTATGLLVSLINLILNIRLIITGQVSVNPDYDVNQDEIEDDFFQHDIRFRNHGSKKDR